MRFAAIPAGGRRQKPVLKSPLHVGFHVALSGAGCDHRGGDRAYARLGQHDARRLAQPLATVDAVARAAAICRHHRDYGDDLGDETLSIHIGAARIYSTFSFFFFICFFAAAGIIAENVWADGTADMLTAPAGAALNNIMVAAIIR